MIVSSLCVPLPRFFLFMALLYGKGRWKDLPVLIVSVPELACCHLCSGTTSPRLRKAEFSEK